MASPAVLKSPMGRLGSNDINELNSISLLFKKDLPQLHATGFRSAARGGSNTSSDRDAVVKSVHGSAEACLMPLARAQLHLWTFVGPLKQSPCCSGQAEALQHC